MNLTLEYSEADLAQIVTAEVRKLLGTAIADGATIKVESRHYNGVKVTIVPPMPDVTEVAGRQIYPAEKAAHE